MLNPTVHHKRDHDDRRHRQVRVVEPTDRLEAERLPQLTDQAELRVQQKRPDQGEDGDRQHIRGEEQRA